MVPGAGELGTNAVVGTSGASDDDMGTYIVSGLVVSLVKSVGIADPFGGSEPVPGAVLTYTVFAIILPGARSGNQEKDSLGITI